MSYILDALKKSEKDRQRGTLPDMLTVQDIVAEKPAKRLPWVYFLVVALLLNAGALTWWLGFSHTNKTNVVETSKTDNIPTLSVNEATQSDIERTRPTHDFTQQGSPEFSGVEKKEAPFIEKTVYANPGKRSDQQNRMPEVPDVKGKTSPGLPDAGGGIVKPTELSSVKPEQTTEPIAIPPAAGSKIVEMPDENRLYALKELPSPVRQGLPSFSVSALLYSNNPASRMVRVNDQMLHEGQALGEDLKLDEITRDGLIFRYQKYRFYVEAK